jgi:hypothetical protein
MADGNDETPAPYSAKMERSNFVQTSTRVPEKTYKPLNSLLRNRVQPDGQITIVACCVHQIAAFCTALKAKSMGPGEEELISMVCCTRSAERRDVMTGRNWTELFSLMKPSQWPRASPCACVVVQNYNAFSV